MAMNMEKPDTRADLLTAFIKVFATREYLRQEEKGNTERAEVIKKKFGLTDLDIDLLRK